MGETQLLARYVASARFEELPEPVRHEPRRGLEGKFSVYHSAAVALIDGAAGEQQYSDERVNDPAVVALRRRVTATASPEIHEDQAVVRIRLAGDRAVEERIDHAVGSMHNPMSDQELAAKFRGVAEPILGPAAASTAIDLVWALDSLSSLGPLLEVCEGDV